MNPILVSAGHISAVSRALRDGCFDILKAPCVFCTYNGKGYWQTGTHREGCPVRDVGGMAERAEALNPCATCGGDPAVCATVPGLRHCEAASRDMRPEAREIELLLRRATVYIEAKHMHIVTTMPEGPPVKHPCAACDLLAEINRLLEPQRDERKS